MQKASEHRHSLIGHDRVLLDGFHDALRLEQNEPQVPLEALIVKSISIYLPTLINLSMQ